MHSARTLKFGLPAGSGREGASHDIFRTIAIGMVPPRPVAYLVDPAKICISELRNLRPGQIVVSRGGNDAALQEINLP